MTVGERMPRLPAAFHRVIVLGATLMLGCRARTPMPLPDAARVSGLALTANPLAPIRPISSGQIHFWLRDAGGRPISDYPVDFAIRDMPEGLASAKLSTEHTLTDARGQTTVELIVGALASNAPPAVFLSVEATCPGTEAKTDVTVQITANAFSVEIVPNILDDGGAAQVEEAKLYFFDNTACSDLDLHRPGPTVRPVPAVANGHSYRFLGVAGSGVHAVMGQGLDGAGIARIAGCVDVPGAALLDDATMRVMLVLDHLFPTPAGQYQVTSDFWFDPSPKGVATILSVWHQWNRCPLDPARLWIDCTLAALTPGAHGKSCSPDGATVGDLGARLAASRGTPVAPLDDTLPNASGTVCRGEKDDKGEPSLELYIDALFSNARTDLSALYLGNFPAELARLFGLIRIASQMTVEQAEDPNGYRVNHRLLGVTFPDAIGRPVSFDSQTLGLPVASASGIVATRSSGQLKFPTHDFNLRLGTATRYAFEASSLAAARNVKDTLGLVNAVIGLAQWYDEPNLLRGCAAMDAIACARIGKPKGCLAEACVAGLPSCDRPASRDGVSCCLVDACQLGLAALADNLADSFGALDGIGKDFSLRGGAPVIDNDADGYADYLGLPGGVAGVAGVQGDWWGTVDAVSGKCPMYGFWSGVPVTPDP